MIHRICNCVVAFETLYRMSMSRIGPGVGGERGTESGRGAAGSCVPQIPGHASYLLFCRAKRDGVWREAAPPKVVQQSRTFFVWWAAILERPGLSTLANRPRRAAAATAAAAAATSHVLLCVSLGVRRGPHRPCFAVETSFERRGCR